MVGKIIGKSIKVICFALVFMFLASLIVSIIKDFINDYDLFDTEDNPAVVTEKFSKKSLTGSPNYYVTVDLNEADSFNGIENQVFSREFKRLEVGDSIKGHHIHGHHFFTTLDIVIDSVVVLIIIILLLFFLLMLLCWPFFVFIEKREEQNKTYKPKKHNKRKIIREKKNEKQPLLKRVLPQSVHSFIPETTFQGIFTVLFFGVVFLLTTDFVINGAYKFSPFGKTSIEGFVVDKDSHSEINYYIGKRSDPYFSLAIEFTDDDEKVYRVIKEVTMSTFEKHYIGDSIKISYENRNPYNIFVRDYSLFNMLQIGLYVKFTYYNIILLGLFIYSAVRINSYRKKKKKLW